MLRHDPWTPGGNHQTTTEPEASPEQPPAAQQPPAAAPPDAALQTQSSDGSVQWIGTSQESAVPTASTAHLAPVFSAVVPVHSRPRAPCPAAAESEERRHYETAETTAIHEAEIAEYLDTAADEAELGGAEQIQDPELPDSDEDDFWWHDVAGLWHLARRPPRLSDWS